MAQKPRSIFIVTLLFAYIIFQFLWWEVLLVKQTTEIANEKQKNIEVNSSDPEILKTQLEELHHKKQNRIYMIAGEGTVFLLLLLFGIYRVKKYQDQERELNERQRNFLLSVTHELKTPITATKLQLQTLQKHKLDKEKENELIENALRENERLNKLIDNVLLASRMDIEKVKLNKEQVNFSEFIVSLLNTYYKNELDKKIIITDLEKDILLSIDKLIFPSVVTNLVENAIKYSPAAEITISLKKQNGSTVFTVADNGPGIPDKDKDTVFEKFYRIGSEEVRSTKGTGLGLYIVKNIVEAHAGKIKILDNSPKGSIFHVAF